MKNTIITLVAGYIVYNYLSSQAKKITYNLESVKIVNTDFQGITIEAGIQIKNDSVANIRIIGFVGSINKGVKIADIALLNTLDIPSKSNGLLRIGAKIFYSGLAGSIANFFENNGNNKVNIRGQLLFENGKRLPININTKLW